MTSGTVQYVPTVPSKQYRGSTGVQALLCEAMAYVSFCIEQIYCEMCEWKWLAVIWWTNPGSQIEVHIFSIERSEILGIGRGSWIAKLTLERTASGERLEWRQSAEKQHDVGSSMKAVRRNQDIVNELNSFSSTTTLRSLSYHLPTTIHILY